MEHKIGFAYYPKFGILHDYTTKDARVVVVRKADPDDMAMLEEVEEI